MKKFLTVLLVIAVMFTFSFGSAFAATNYTAADYATALSTEMNNQLSYLANAKAQALNAITYDEDGFFKGYSKEAYTAAADKVIENASAEMEQAVRDAADKVPAGGTTTAPDKAVVTVHTENLLTGSGMMAAMLALTDGTMDKTQEPITKAFYEGKLNAVDASKYATTGDNAYGDVTGLSDAEYVEVLVAVAQKAITTAAADTTKDAAAKIAAYTTAYGNFKADFDKVVTAADKELVGKETAKDVAGAVNNYLAKGAVVYAQYKLTPTDDVKIYEVKDELLVAPFYTAKTSKAKATLFGVEIANIDRITKEEALAVNDAFYAAIQASADVVKKACKTVGEVKALEENFLNTLGNAMKVAEVYADVVEYGADLKAEYSYGVKVYNDAAVDKVVAEAEELVYADLGGTLKTAKAYFEAAMAELKMVEADIQEVNYEYQRLMAAIKDAKDKFQAAPVNYGANKTAAEDVQYCKNQYAASEAGNYDDIKADAIDALDAAESYADIDAALADASAELAKLMKAADAAAVATAQSKYAAALTTYADSVKALVDMTDYDYGQYVAALADGQDAITEAVTVDGVVAAFEEAKTLFNNLKTDDEIDALKADVVKKINALPYQSAMTLADKAAVEEAYAAYAEYKAVYGAPEVANVAVLKTAVDKIADLEAAELNEKIDGMEKALDKVDSGSDADITAYVAMKADVEALVAEAKAFNKDVKAKEKVLGDITDAYADVDALAGLLGTEKEFWDKEVDAAEIALYAASKDGASVEAMKAALDAYNALSDRQTYLVDYSVLQMAKLVQANLSAEVEALKITARSSAKKGSITVKWTVKGNEEAADGYQIWKSTKKNSGFKKAFTTAKQSYKNTKGLKKGTRYYYKVRAYITIDGKNVYSDWSNKAYRVAK